jgi:hypothetical protein
MMGRSKTVWAACLAAAVLCLTAVPGTLLAQTSGKGPTAEVPVLVELFTSEGCSSCPPADALLRQMDGKRIETGQRIIALSEHVTYWNRLGWADPFSSDTMTQRQRDYGESFHLDDVYTPQMVVNGERQMSGNDPRAVQQAVQAQQAESRVKVEILALDAADAASQGRGLRVRYSVSGSLPGQGLDIYAALADDQDTTQVRRGENAGRVLTHVSVVRSLVRAGRAKVPTQGTAVLPFPESVGADYRGGRHVVVFAQLPGPGKVMSAAMRPVEPFPTAGPAAAAVH